MSRRLVKTYAALNVMTIVAVVLVIHFLTPKVTCMPAFDWSRTTDAMTGALLWLVCLLACMLLIEAFKPSTVARDDGRE